LSKGIVWVVLLHKVNLPRGAAVLSMAGADRS
jgi:hypothetical protein